MRTAREEVSMTDLSPGIRHQISQSGALSNDTRVLILFEANKKIPTVAYILWVFLGWFGGHNFYLGRIGVAVAQLILTLTVIGWFITVIWVFVDGFLIPSWVRDQNNLLASQLGA
jgi:TM2 domain-containing membrane protein YozV